MNQNLVSNIQSKKLILHFVFVAIHDIVVTFNIMFVLLKGKKAKIHEDSNGNIYITGVTTRMVNSEEEVRMSDFIAIVAMYVHDISKYFTDSEPFKRWCLMSQNWKY